MLDSAADDHAEAPSTPAPPPKKLRKGVRVLVVERGGVLGKECRTCGAEWLPLGAFHKDSEKAGGRQSKCRVCDSAANAHWQANNPERAKANNAHWRADNTDHMKVYDARRYTKNPECKKASNGRWTKNNPTKIAAQQALRLERFQAAGPDLPHYIKLQVWEAAEGQCEYCGVSVPAPRAKDHMEHRIPLTRGGTNALANRGVSCKRCQSRKGRKTLQEWVDYSHMLALADCA